MVHSHWSNNVKAWLSLVESFIVLLRQLSYAIKNQLVALERKISPLGAILLAPIPYAIKNQRGASKDPTVGSLGSKAPSRGLRMPELVLYGIRELAEQHYEALDQ